jgi:hypothetical protein
MSFISTLYGAGNKPHFVSYDGGSTYTTQTYCELPQWKLATTMTTEFGHSISGNTKPIAEFDGSVFNGYAEGLWIYRLYLDGHLVGTYQFQNQAFFVPIAFDRVEGVCMSIELTPSVAFTDTTAVVPTSAGFAVLITAAFMFTKRRHYR